MRRLDLARRVVETAVVNRISAQMDHEDHPESYGAMASSELADEVLDEALAAYVTEFVREHGIDAL